MVNEYKDLKKNKNHVLFFITSLIVVFVGLTLIIKPLMKSDKERMQEHFTEDVVKGMVQDAFSKYIDLKIRDISVDYDAIDGANSILAYGDATSKQYGGKKFSYRIEFAIDDDATTKGAFNDDTDFNLAKGRLVGFKVKNGKHQHLDYSHVDKMAKCTKSDTRYVGRWYVNEYNYVCNLYNLNIHKSETSNGDYGYDYYETINVYWNSYLRRYD